MDGIRSGGRCVVTCGGGGLGSEWRAVVAVAFPPSLTHPWSRSTDQERHAREPRPAGGVEEAAAAAAAAVEEVVVAEAVSGT